ncbi:MAG: hypothetical protein JNL11_12075 [Bdellovibrionaceae bacterium]|nr:hypothetical protein [Pseudobdellovibrionaceae bacterium]
MDFLHAESRAMYLSLTCGDIKVPQIETLARYYFCDSVIEYDLYRLNQPAKRVEKSCPEYQESNE